MELEEMIDQFATPERFPFEAVTAARENRTALLPAFLQIIGECCRPDAPRRTLDAGFFIFHLLGEWREKSAYRPLAALLRAGEQVEAMLGDGAAITAHKVMAAVFDGDPQPLYDIIRDPDADGFVRSQMCEALAMVTLAGELPREEAIRFLHGFYSESVAPAECFVWDGWQSAIALLGLVEMRDLVRQAFDNGFIDPMLLSFEDFEEDLDAAVAKSPEFTKRVEREFSVFGDTIEELSNWYCFSEEYRKKLAEREQRQRRQGRQDWLLDEDEASGLTVLETLARMSGPATNPNRNVGRNDPCPCGSGKKFKKCCLRVEASPIGLAPATRSAA
jgi:hypothetical protein